MIDYKIDTKYYIDYTTRFKKQFKNIAKQGKDLNKFLYVLKKLANKEKLERKYKDHELFDDRNFKDCRECHIESDWLLVYQYQDEKLVLLLVSIGSHSELF